MNLCLYLCEVFVAVLLSFAAGLPTTPATKTTVVYFADHCGEQQTVAEGELYVKPTSRDYFAEGPACAVVFSAKELLHATKKLSMRFVNISSVAPVEGVCHENRIDVYDGIKSFSHEYTKLSPEGGICGKTVPTEYVASGTSITVVLDNRKRDTKGTFAFTVTVFHEGTCLEGEEFACSNGRCISNNLKCNNVDNCDDNSDEDSCNAIILSTAAIIGIGVASGVVFLCILACCIRRCCRGSERDPDDYWLEKDGEKEKMELDISPTKDES